MLPFPAVSAIQLDSLRLYHEEEAEQKKHDDSNTAPSSGTLDALGTFSNDRVMVRVTEANPTAATAATAGDGGGLSGSLIEQHLDDATAGLQRHIGMHEQK